jgi:hypothetical protein
MRQTRLERIEQLCRAWTLAVPLFAGVGCFSQHEGPHVSDTATNWLKGCTSDAVCGGGRCIDKVCTTTCSVSAPNACERLDENASCETDGNTRPICDLTCSNNAACEDFRVGYTCQSGRCRVAQVPPLPPSDAGAAPPTDAGAIPVVDAGPVTQSDSATVPPPADGGSSVPPSLLVSTLSSEPIAPPHRIRVLRAADGMPFDPPIELTTLAGLGSFGVPPIPGNVPITLHVVGEGPASNPSSTYDSVKIGYDPTTDSMVRIHNVGTATIQSVTGGYTIRQDRAPLDVTVYVRDDNRFVGAVGCAQAFLDGSSTAAAEADLRYTAANELPTTLSMLSATRRGAGRFSFGNISKGPHTLRISVDGGATFIAEVPFFVPLTRAEAVGDYKTVYMRLDVAVTGADPTPASCPPQ